MSVDAVAMDSASAPLAPTLEAARPISTHAFGVPIDTQLAIPGLERAAVRPPGPPLSLEYVAAEDLQRAWRPERATRLVHAREHGDSAMTIDADPRLGFRVWVAGHGTLLLDRDGLRLRCAAEPGSEPWRWQRTLIAHTLPFAAVLRGLEVLHASAVRFDGHVVALVAASGTGKTSLALALLEHGAELLCDDALAVEVPRGRGDTLAHSGAGLVNLRTAEALEWCRRGCGTPEDLLPGDEGEVRVKVSRRQAPAPLSAVCVLQRTHQPGRLDIRECRSSTSLLGATFNLTIRSPERLMRHLDFCAALANTVRVCHVSIPAGMDARQTADALRAQWGRLTG